ncbi:uncharacterized protein N7458_005848 [Penicillium daleae]|uniref:Zn(2)-C6 fungal-type domain-containing protein n=1 Tax=Penicillium daleae TaxID=63821 RepID=A0AAD6C8U8_9EURO|nr:uncharacterized protein N7458_005848 [Penicillium daleae]KAJ5454892.1 hypothetical protein N7458_005848 [Penicillium daleae]
MTRRATLRSRKPVKRSKTFTGCWTCRSRGVKCDEGKPICSRCEKGLFTCAGYGVKLIWPGDGAEGAISVQRRLLSRMQHEAPTLSDQALDLFLESLDSSVTDQEFCGPFSVFRLSWSTISEPDTSSKKASDDIQLSICVHEDTSPIQNLEADDASISFLFEQDANPPNIEGYIHGTPEEMIFDDLRLLLGTDSSSSRVALGSESYQDAGMLLALYDSRPGTLQALLTDHTRLHISHSDDWSPLDTDAAQNVETPLPALESDFSLEDYIIQIEMADFLHPIIPPGTSEERQLMHYWVTYLSNLMVSVESPDNPYRTLWVPIALYSSVQGHEVPGHAALLHAIYAISAFNQVQRSSTGRESLSITATKHYQLSLGYLRKALTEDRGSQREAILATISTMSFIEVINGNSSTWRDHLKGGREWLRSFERTKWNGPSTSILYQLFLCAEALGSSLSSMASNARSGNFVNICDEEYTHNCVFGVTSLLLESEYCLDRYFGITLPILEAIIHITHLSVRPRRPSMVELEGLEVKIRLNKPTPSHSNTFAASGKHIAMDYARVFYYACYIHFKHTLLRVHSRNLQDLVRQSLKHLEAIEIHEATSRNCGLLWPIFIIACEADEKESRITVSKWFMKGQSVGVANVTSAAKVVVEVWRRRDVAKGCGMDDFVCWGNVMAEMGLDVLLL